MRTLHRLLIPSLVLAACTQQQLPEPAASPEHHEEALFTNSGFETGSLTGWTVTTNLVATSPGVTTYPVTSEAQLGLRAGGNNLTSVKTGAPYTLIPPGLTASEAARYPRFGNWAAVVNELGSSYNANRITQSSVVTTADIDPADGLVHVRFTVLPVLQNPGHSLREQPYYYVTITNTTKGTVLSSRFNFSNEAGVPWQTNAAGSVVYTDWLLFDLPLSRSAVSIGDTLTAVIIAGGCAQSGHWGEAIIDSFGSSIPGLVVYGSGPDSVEAGSDFQYTYRVLNGGSATTTGTRLTSYLPAGTTFRSVDTAGVTCTAPTVGTRGTLTCNLGALASGGSRTVKITVRADATATGTIRHGWYYSSSDQDQPLTGPLVSTNVTTGGTTQYVDLVTSVDDTASSVMWGQHNTWAVTVRNAGASTATAASIVTNAPAQLTNVTWTCTPQPGASCGAASGTGALATTATLPAGKSVTYTIEADVIAGSGTALLSYTALATAPAGTVETFSLDNGAGDDDTISGSMVSVSLTRAGTGSGTLVSSPAGVTCGTGCSGTTGAFAAGTQVTIQAVPATGSVFAGWSSGTCSGTAPCTFTAAAGQTITGTFTANPILITSPATATAAVGRPFSYTTTALGTAPITLGASGLPAWLSFDAATGVLSGTAPAAGTYTVTLSATDVNGTDTQVLTITAGNAPTITSALTYTIAGATTAWGTIDVNASGDLPIQFNASNLPGTVYFNSTTGVFAGNAGAVGVYNVPVIATNAFGSDYKVLAVSVGGAPVITSALTSSATVGTAWSYTLTATGTPTITLSVSSLPAWASFNATSGVISGTPTSAGTVSIGLRAANSIGASNQTLVLTVDGPAVITSATTASGTAGEAFTYSLTAEGTGPITRSMTGLPAWLSFDAATGLLSGTPPAAGTYTVTMGATNALGSDTKTLTITVVNPPPTPTPPAINPPLTASGLVGTAFSYGITANGQVPMTFSASGLPAWASVDPATGLITGTPTAVGTFTVTIGATNALGSDSKTLVITVAQPPAITSSSTAAAQVGQPFSYTLTASGSAPLTLSASGLPAWASFDSGTGVISGTPTADGDFSISLGATNAVGSASGTLVISVRTPPAITSALTADAVVGDAFSYTLTASGSAPITFTTGTLPGWATFTSGTGVISGTPTAAGTINVSIAASNTAGSDTRTLVITVRQRPSVTSALTASGVVGQAFSYTLTASGTAPLTLSAASLPAWASFNASTGVISGTPTADGTFTVSLGASNSVGADAKTLTLTVRTVPSITSALSASGVVGQPFSYTVTASGTAPITLSATSLPAWASFNAGTGVISGTPTADGTFTISLGASNAAGSDAKTLTLTVRTTPTITSALSASGVVGQPFSYTLTASGTAPITLSATSLPAWASFNAGTGVISGTPTADGTFTISLGASNAAGSDAKTLTLTVRTVPSITSALSASGVVGQPFSYTLTASGTAPITLSATSLPAWASFNAGTGVISGTPTADGTFTVSLGASNAAGSDAKTLTLTVRTTPTITSALSASGVVGQPFSYTLTASGTAPITLSATSLPAWASFNAGVISGTPTADGTFTISLGASNAAGSDAKTLTLTVRTVPSITSALSASGVVGQPFSYTLTASGTAPITLSATSLPAWASFNAGTGVISGTPTADGTFTISLGASNAAGSDAKTLTLTVRTTPSITSALTASGVVGQPFSYALTTSGTSPITLSATSLPAWATFDAGTGVISGTPTADGTFTISLGASNAAGSDSETLTLTVRTVPSITSTLSTTAVVGQPFSYTLTSSGTAPFTFSASSLPAWASFDPATGVISGTPTSDVDAVITLSASNPAGSDTQQLTIVVRAVPSITSALAVDAIVGEAFSYTLTATGTAPLTLDATSLPAWASFNASTGVLSGTPTDAATLNVTLSATNAAGGDTETLVITVRTRPFITSPLSASAVVSEAFTYVITGSGTPALTFTVGALPAWLHFDGTDTLTGTPPADATVTVDLTVTNFTGSTTRTLTIVSRTRPAITNVLLVRGVVGTPLELVLTATGTAPLTFGATPLPAGLAFDGTRITGTPTAAGTFQVTESVTNATGTVTATIVFELRSVVPAPIITQPAEGASLPAGTTTLAGTAPTSEAGNTVRVTENGTTVCEAVIQPDGSWSCAATLPEGAHQVSAVIVDVHGFVGGLSDTQAFTIDLTAPQPPAWTGPAAGSHLADRAPRLSGTGEPGATITVTRGTEEVCSAIVATDGTWACTPVAPLPEGAVTLDVAQTDAAGNRSPATARSFFIDVTAPALPTITGPANGALVSSSTPTLTGTAEPGASVEVSVDGVHQCTTTADEQGHWSCVPPAPLADGQREVRATATDVSGNQSDAGTSAFVIDTTTPPPPVIAGPTGRISDPTPTITGTAEPGATVVVTLDGQPLCTTTADAEGRWSCPVSSTLSEGAHTITATARDAAGHVSTVATGTFEVQTATGTVTEPGGTSTTDNGRLCGTATPGSTVNVYVDGKLVGTSTADADGQWCFDLPLLTAGAHDVAIGVTNSSGEEVYRSDDQVLTVEKPIVDFGGGIGCSATSQAPTGLFALLAVFFLARRRRAVRAAAVVALAAAPALAQVAVSNFELEQLVLNPGARGGLVVGGADLLAPKDWRLAATLGYQYAPLKYFENGTLRANLVDHRLTASVHGAASVLPWLELGATIPVVLVQGGEPVMARTGAEVVSAVPASAALGTPWLQGRMAVLQERNGQPLDLGLTLMFGLPLGSATSLTRESTVSGQVLVGAGRTFGSIRVAAEAGAHLREASVLVAGSEAVGSRVLLDAAASTVGGPLRGEFSVRTFIPLTAQPVSAELLVGLRYALRDWELFGIAGPGFGNAPGTPVFRAVLGASFGGVKSGRCGGRPSAAFIADCPGLDFDGDGVLNGDDACPLQPSRTTTGCAPAPVVVAPTPPAVEEPPAPAPTPAPPADSDGDGVTDDVDACPALAGSQADGCEPPPPPATVAVAAGHLELKGKVYFDTSKATIQPRSFPLLDEVVTVMKAHPEVQHVLIEGHTDARGDAAFNLKLSDDRAKAVRDYLVKGGIEPARLEAKGFGLTRPVAAGNTAEAHEQNRRVEFIILE